MDYTVPPWTGHGPTHLYLPVEIDSFDLVKERARESSRRLERVAFIHAHAKGGAKSWGPCFLISKDGDLRELDHCTAVASQWSGADPTAH